MHVHDISLLVYTSPDKQMHYIFSLRISNDMDTIRYPASCSAHVPWTVYDWHVDAKADSESYPLVNSVSCEAFDADCPGSIGHIVVEPIGSVPP